jgi:NTP pyrophosphatase (non-canonical NTP hydrolase)
VEEFAVRETQKTISEWAENTFGPSGSCARVAARANEEMAELLRALTSDDANIAKAAEEIADVVIVLYRLATRLGVDIQFEIEQKMEINRNRVWTKDGTGHGYHLRNK